MISDTFGLLFNTKKKSHMNVIFISIVAAFIHWMGGDSKPVVSCKKGEPAVTNLIMTSADGGKTWTDLSKGLPAVEDIRDILVTDKETYVAVGRNHLFRLVSPGVWEKENIGASMMGGFMTQDSSNEANYFLGVFQGNNGPYVSINESGLFQKKVSGDWQAVHTDLPDNRIYNIIELEDGSTLVATEGGIFRKAGKEGKWLNVLADKWASNMAHNGAVIMASTPSGVWVSHNYGTSWTNTINDKIGNYDLYASTDKLYAVKPSTASINKDESYQAPETAFMSSDKGRTWTPINKGLLQVERLYQVVQNGKTLISSNSQGIGISADQGYNWENVFGKPGTENMMIWKLVQRGSSIYAVKSWSGC